MKLYSTSCVVLAAVFTLCLYICIRVTNAKTYVSARVANSVEKDNTTLQCTYISNATRQDETTLEWTCWFNGEGHAVLRNRYGTIATGPGCPGMNLTGRVSFVGGQGGNGSASMMISDLRIKDSGTFQCKVSIDNTNGGTDEVRVNLDVLQMRQVSIDDNPTCNTNPASLQAHGQVTGVQNKTEVWWTEANNTNFNVTKTVYNNNNAVGTNVTVLKQMNYNYTFTLHTYHPIAGRPEINYTRTMHCDEVLTTVQAIHVPAVTLLVLASVTIIASVVLIVFVVHFALACKKENASPNTTENRTSCKQRAFSPKMWLFVVFGVVAIIIGVTFIAIASIDLHSNGSVGVSVGIALCIIFLIMNIFFIIGFIKHKIKDKRQDENRQGTVVANPANSQQRIDSPSDKSNNYSDRSNLGRNINQNYNGSFNQQKDDKSSYDPNYPKPDYDDPKPDPKYPGIRSNPPNVNLNVGTAL